MSHYRAFTISWLALSTVEMRVAGSAARAGHRVISENEQELLNVEVLLPFVIEP